MVLRFVDPFNEIDRMMQRFGSTGAGLMPMDVYEKDGTFVICFDLPGVDPDDVEMTVESNVLTVTAERPLEDTEGANWMVRERPSGRHSRQLRLGPSLDASKVEANYDHGVLTVQIPVREEAKPFKVSIKAGAHQVLES